MSTCVSLGGDQTIRGLNWFYKSPVADRINMEQADGVFNCSNVVGQTPDMILASSGVKATLAVRELKEHAGVNGETEHTQQMYCPEQHASETALKQYVHDDTQGVSINLSERASGSQKQHLSGEERMLELKEFPLEQEDKTLESECFETIQKRVRLVKAYACVKEEMVRATANTVASYLYQHQPILLSLQELEDIYASKQRRDAVELLLKRVLMGPDDIHVAFVGALKKEGGEDIAEQLYSGKITEEDIETFVNLEKSAEHGTPRPDSDKPRMTFTDTQRCTLSYWIKERSVIDSINDHFLSRLIFRINEHTDIADSSMDSKKKLQRLIKTLKLCSENNFKDFCEILDLDIVCMPHVITKLNTKHNDAVVSRQKEKRKSSSPMEDIAKSTPSKQQRMQNSLSGSNESRIVQSIQQPGSNVRNKAHELGLEVIGTEKGSIIIQLAPKDSDSWLILKSRCRDGKIKDFIPEIFRNNQDDLKEGEYRFKFTIYVLPTSSCSPADKRVMFHLEAKQTLDIQEHSKLLCEELEITDDLLAKLQKEKVVDENNKRDIAKIRTRRSKTQCLLNQIASHGERGYSILKEHIKTTNTYLYGRLDVGDDTEKISSTLPEAAGITPKPASASRGIKKEVFYSAELVLLVNKTEVADKDGKKRSEVEITCPTIVSSKCVFNGEEENYHCDSDEEYRSLEQNWMFSTEQQSHEEFQEELGGKRKSRASSDSGDVFTAREFPDKKVYDETNKDVSKELKIPVTGTVQEGGGKRKARASSESVDVSREFLDKKMYDKSDGDASNEYKIAVTGNARKEDNVTTLEKLKTTAKGEKTGKQNKEKVSN